jgi:zinc protease
MGNRKLGAQAVEERIDQLGAQLSISCATSYVHVGGAVVAHNLEPFVALLGSLVGQPAFRGSDVARAKRETIAELRASCDDDRTLCGRHFRSFCLPDHVYGRTITGRVQTVQGISTAQVRNHHQRHYVSENAVIGFSGAITAARAGELVARHLGLPKGKAPSENVPAPHMPKGRRVLIVDKPERTQTQILMGTLGTHSDDADHIPFGVGNVTFGGLFSSRLTHEIRTKRGWSYGASSSVGHDRQRELWSMWTFPSAETVTQCIALQLSLYEDWLTRGVRPAELSIAKSYLIKSHAFEVDTAAKRLDQRIETEVFGLPADYHDGFPARVAAVTRNDVNAAIVRRLSRRDLSIVVVATAKDVERDLARLPGVSQVSVVPFERV